MIFFFYGTNSFMLRQKLREMTTTYLDKTGSDMGLERLDGATISLERLRSALQAAPFLATSRLVIIEGVGKNKVVAAKMEKILSLVPSSTVAVFFEGDPDQRTVYYKTMIAQAKSVHFAPMTSTRLASWVKAEIERFGGSVDRQGVTLLLDLTGGDQWRLSEEIQKLVNYRSEVSIETINLLVESGLDQNIFDLTDAMANGRAGDALETFRKLIVAREDEFKILGMVQWQLRNLLLAKAAGQITAAELAKIGGLSPYVAGKMQTAARRYDLSILREAYIEAVDTEYAMKTGALPAELGVERLIYSVATAIAGRRSA